MLTFVKVLLVPINHERITSTKAWISQESQDQAIRLPCEQISHSHFLANQQYALTKCLLISDGHQCCQILQIAYVHDNEVVTVIVQCDIGVVQDIVQVPCPVELQHKRVKAKAYGVIQKVTQPNDNRRQKTDKQNCGKCVHLRDRFSGT